MNKTVKYLANNMSKELAVKGAKQAGKYGKKVVILGGLGIATGYFIGKSKEIVTGTTKNINKAIEKEFLEASEIAAKKRKPEPVKKVKEYAKGTIKLVGAAAAVGAIGVITYKTGDVVRKQGSDLFDEITADYRSLQYDINEAMTIDNTNDEIDYE